MLQVMCLRCPLSFCAAMKMRMYLFGVLLAAMLPVNSAVYAWEVPDCWNGIAGEALKRAVERDCRPTASVSSFAGENGYWAIMKLTDISSDGRSYLNRFSGNVLQWPPSLSEGPVEMVLVNVIPWEWWDARSGFQAGVKGDLYNLVPALTWVENIKWRYAPGTVTEPSFDNGYWKAGTGMFDGAMRHLWQPPRGYEGDVARVVFYLFAAYPEGVAAFGHDGALYGSVDYYPGLSDAAVRQLLAWHRGDPPDDLEKRRNAVFSSHQGNVNPFVEVPELAEFLWGDKKGMPFGVSGAIEPEASLKAVYSIDEPRINLRSGHVPADARWSVDGEDVSRSFLVPAELGAGVHELRFESAECRGKILIEIVR